MRHCHPASCAIASRCSTALVEPPKACTTLIAFFLAEMGDKTQIATVALAARFPAEFIGVVMGTTAGMMIANVPAVLLGERIAERMPVRLVHGIAALIFAKWRPWGALGATFLFGLLEAIANRYPNLDLGIVTVPSMFMNALPYILTVIILAGFVGRAIPPRAGGEPYVKER